MALLGMVILLVSALFLVGCGNTGGQEGSNNQGQAEQSALFENLDNAPVTIDSAQVQKAPLYHDVPINYTNKTDKFITKIEFALLLFDQEGKPAIDSHSQSSLKRITTKKQLAPQASGSGVWNVTMDALKMKVRLARVEYLDGSTWEDPDIQQWVEQEIAKF